MDSSNTNSLIINFHEDVSTISVPPKFTFPFYYQPHPLSIIAANQLQQHLQIQTDWKHDFGLSENPSNKALGKMFGVLVVQDTSSKLGFLAAFSGILANKTTLPYFVPPVYNRQSESSFYAQLESELNRINQQIKVLENDTEYLKLVSTLENDINESVAILTQKRKEIKQAKSIRNLKRTEAKNSLSEEEYQKLEQTLTKESMDLNFGYKRLAKYWKQKNLQNQELIQSSKETIEKLKLARKQKSAALQLALFDKYEFLNYNHQIKGVVDIFKDTVLKQPPAGSGDCAAPKLLQYAFQNNLKPIAMAEFWWGKSPKQEVRKHRQFYPSCRSKCEPILTHMLKGLDVDENPMNEIGTQKKISILYEDEAIAVINKPVDLLSVPGKKIKDSVFTRITEMFPEAKGPLIIHRLDRATSGIMLIAKTKKAHKILQKQFQNRVIKKKYTAILDGSITKLNGTINLPLRVDLDNRPSQLVCFEHGKKAITKWEIIEIKNNQTRVSFYPETGRTHQLRVHAAHQLGLNTPILGDDIYGNQKNQLHLHATEIEFIHPVSNQWVKFECEPGF